MLHYLITNREILFDAKGNEYIREDGLDKAGEKGESLRIAFFNPDKYREKFNCRSSIKLLSSPDLAREKLENSFDVNGDVLCYIHGFHTDLPGVLKDVCLLEKRYIREGSPVKYIVAITWPARNSVFAYDDDCADAEASGYSFAQSYHVLTDFFNIICGSATRVRNIHLLVHSMGNRMLEHLLLNLACKLDYVFKPLFKEVVLVAADTDWHGFEEEYAFEKLKLLSERITIYHHQGDLALYLSEMIQNKNKRLGRHGFRDCKRIRGQVYSVDCTSIIDDSGLMFRIVDHSYFQVSNTAINDIIYTLRGKPIDEFLSQSLRIIKSSSERAFRLVNRQW